MLRESGDLVEKAMIDVQDSQVEYLQKQLDNESDDDQEQKESKTKKIISEPVLKTLDFVKVPTKDTFGQNLKKSSSIITLWKIEKSGYVKIKELFIYDATKPILTFSKDGKKVLLTHKDDCTISIYNAETLELISKYTLKCEDTHGNDLTQFSEFALSFNGDYILAGDEKAKSVFNYDGKFIRNIEIEGIQIIDYFHDTYYIGLEDNESGDYTHKSLIKVDFVTLEKETVYEFESDSIVFGALDPKMEWIMFSQATITYFVDLKSKSTPIKMFQSDNDKQKYVVLGSKVGVLYWNEETFIMQVCVYEKSELVWSHQVEERGKLDIESLSFNDLNNEYGLVFLEKIGQNYRMHQFNETTGINYALKSVKNVTFQYPFLYYIKGQKEIWIQDMHNNIKIFYLNENI